MANALFDPGREGFLDGSISWAADDIRVMLVLSSYSFDASNKFVADLGSVDNGRSAALNIKTTTNGVADAADTSLIALAAAAVAPIAADVQKVNAIEVVGTGALGNEWGPVP